MAGKKHKTKFVIAGLGSIGRRHLRNLIALGENDIVLLRNRLSTLPDDELNGFLVVNDIESALACRPEAIIISNPTSMHLDIAIPAAKAGCHILIEKPVSNSFARLDELKSALEIGRGQLLVGFQYRFHPMLQLAFRLLLQGEIGKPISIYSHWGEYLPDWHPWEDFKGSYAARADLGGGVVLTLCHPFDYLSWLFGKPSLEWARTSRMGDWEIDVEDVAEACLKFPNGALGMLHLDYIQRPAEHYLEIIGTKGTIRWNNTDGQLALFRHSRPEWELHELPKGFERNSMFMDEMRHFLSVVRGEAPPVCTLIDGINALELALQTLSFKAN